MAPADRWEEEARRLVEVWCSQQCIPLTKDSREVLVEQIGHALRAAHEEGTREERGLTARTLQALVRYYQHLAEETSVAEWREKELRRAEGVEAAAAAVARQGATGEHEPDDPREEAELLLRRFAGEFERAGRMEHERDDARAEVARLTAALAACEEENCRLQSGLEEEEEDALCDAIAEETVIITAERDAAIAERDAARAALAAREEGWTTETRWAVRLRRWDGTRMWVCPNGETATLSASRRETWPTEAEVDRVAFWWRHAGGHGRQWKATVVPITYRRRVRRGKKGAGG